MRGSRLSVVGVGALLALAGCGSDGGERSASGSASGSASASPSTSASPVDGAEAKKRAASATRKALLPDSAFAKVGLDLEQKPKEDKWDWFESCRPFLASESRQVTGYNGRWKGKGLVVNQTVVAYPDGVAEDIVGEVARTVTCTEYAAGDVQFSKVAEAKLPEVKAADATHAWCMHSSKGYEVCHSVLAEQDLISSLWVIADSKGESLDALGALTILAAERIKAQVR